MYLVAIAWLYVVVMMAAAEALSPQGTVLGAVITLMFYGVLPLSVLMYILGTPMRRRARLRSEQEQEQDLAGLAQEGAAAVSEPPDGSSHAAGEPVAAERKEG